MFENEMQQALLIVALVVFAGIYFYSRAKNKTSDKSEDKTQNQGFSEKKAMQDTGALAATSDQPSKENTKENTTENTTQDTAENSSNIDDKLVAQEDSGQSLEVPEEISITERHKLPSDHELYVPESQLPFDFELQAPPSSVEDVIEVKDQNPEENSNQEDLKTARGSQEQKTYAILVLSPREDLTIHQVVAELEALQLTENANGFYEKVEKGEQIFMVANALEPGTFKEETGANIVTQGVILILNLPNPVVPAPRAMGDLIDMSRRLSQRLNGKMYSAQRQLMRETDLQSMREAALDYESTKLGKL